MSEKDILTEVLQTVFKMSAEQVADLLYQKSDDSEEVLIKEGAAKSILGEISKQTKARLEEHGNRRYNEGRDKSARVYESAIKAAAPDLADMEATGEELVMAFKEALTTNVKPPQMEENAVKKSKIFLETEAAYKAEIAKRDALLKEWPQKHESALAQKDRALIKRDIAQRKFEAYQPVLEEDELVRKTRIGDYFRDLEGFDFEEVDGKRYAMQPMPDGSWKRVEDEQYNPLTIDEVIERAIKSRFTQAVQPQKGNAGNANSSGGQGGGIIKVPTSKDEYEKAYWNETDPAKRQEITKAFEAQNRPQPAPVT